MLYRMLKRLKVRSPDGYASQSEIVVPLVYADGATLGVWDVDSFFVNRFDDNDRRGMEALCTLFMSSLQPAQ